MRLRLRGTKSDFHWVCSDTTTASCSGTSYYRHCFLNSEEQASGNIILRILYDAIHFASH